MSLFQKLFLLVSSLFLIISCSAEPDTVGEIRTGDLPSIELEHLLSINEPDGQYFEFIMGIKSDSKGRIYLADQRANRIHVYNSDGEYITGIGREGSGPTEFRGIVEMFIDRNDRLFIYDISNARSVVFEETDGEWRPNKFLSIEGTRLGVISGDINDNVILRQSKDQMPTPGAYRYVHSLAKGHLDSGLIENSVIEFRERGYMVRDDGYMDRIPFGRTTLLATDPDGHLYMNWNESFDVAVYNSKIDLVDSISVNIPNQLISSEERSEILNSADLFRALIQNHMPETKPVAKNMWADGEGKIWLQTYDLPEYLVVDQTGTPLGSFDLEEGMEIYHVDENRVYTLKMDDEGYEVDLFSFKNLE